MSDAGKGRVLRRVPLRLVVSVALTALVCTVCSKEDAFRRTLREAAVLYGQGKYAEAMPLLQKARDAGLKDGTLLYQLGYCRSIVEGKQEIRTPLWQEAETLLVEEIKKPQGATLERLYELAVIHSDRKEWDKLNQYATQAFEQYEKGPDPNALTGEDWFRLGRLHDLASQPSEAEAAYRRSVSAFSRAKEGVPIYRSLALSKVAEYDLEVARYPLAASEFDEALKLFPANNAVRPFLHGVALVGARRLDDAVAKFDADRTESNAESQYAADLVRKAQAVAPLDNKDTDGIDLKSIPDDVLQERIVDASKALRTAREKNSYRPGDPLPAEVAMHQKRFVTLLGEQLVRTRALQEFCLKEGIADLVRR